MLESTEKGGVRNSIRNCLTVFQNDPLLSGAIAKNLLTERTDIIKPIGYHRTGTAITDTDMNYLLLYLEETYGLTSEKKIAARIVSAEPPDRSDSDRAEISPAPKSAGMFCTRHTHFAEDRFPLRQAVPRQNPNKFGSAFGLHTLRGQAPLR